MAGKEKSLSIIDKDCFVEGTLNVKGKLIIAGSLKGTLVGNTVVTVEGSCVDAPAKVREMTIGGDFQGDVTVYETLRILSTGVFSGKVSCKNITLETGGKLNGRVKPLDSEGGLTLPAETTIAAVEINPASGQVGGDGQGAVLSKAD